MVAFEHFGVIREDGVEQALIQTLQVCCGIDDPTLEDIEYLLQRFEQAAKVQPAAEKTATHKTKSLGTAYRDMLASLPLDRVLLWMVGFDYTKAEQIYLHVDRDVALQMVDDFLKISVEQNNYLFEAVMYGFGGSYKDDAPPDEDVVDLRDASPERMKAELGALFGV